MTLSSRAIDALTTRLKRIRLALRLLIIPVLLVYLLLALPMVGNFVVLGGAHWLGCFTGENMIHSCIFLGSDIGEFVYGYIVDIFILGMFNPFFATEALLAFLHTPVGIAWLLALLGLLAAGFITRRELRLGDVDVQPRKWQDRPVVMGNPRAPW